MSSVADEVRDAGDRLRSERRPYVTATVVRAERPTSAKAGDRALILEDGTVVGFVGGDCAASSVQLHALGALTRNEPLLLRIDPAAPDPPLPAAPDRPALPEASDALPDVGSPEPGLQPVGAGAPAASPPAGDDAPAGGAPAAGSAPPAGVLTVHNPCLSGGTLEIFLEPVRPPALAVVHGDAPIARAVRSLSVWLGYETRPWSSGEDVAPGCDVVLVASHGGDEGSVIRAALAAGVPYVGLVASPRRANAVLDLLDLSEEDRQRVHSPAGLDIGSRTPEEVALSIFADVVDRRPRRPAAAGPDRAGVGPARPERGPGSTATDPVCGMAVAAVETTRHLDHGGTRWWFCGSGCEAAFRADPAGFSNR
ncbi:MAG: XdhC family protein [Acidimicrobiales bacterium]